MPQPPPDPIPHHRGANCPAHHKAHARRLRRIGNYQQMTGEQWAPGPAAALRRGREIGSPPHSRCRREHCPSAAAARQTLTRERPFRRLAERIARPARVRMRSRKPCVFARRRLFGWNVRLVTGTPDSGQSEDSGAPDRHQAALNPHRGNRTNTRYAQPRWPVKPTAADRSTNGH